MLTREVHFSPGYDKRSTNPNKNYGISGMHIYFILKGELGAINFSMLTQWYPKYVQEELFNKGTLQYSWFEPQPMATDLGYHTTYPQYDGQEISHESCAFLNGRPCYYGGSTLNAEPIRDIFLTEGDEGVWRELELRYIEEFGEDK